GPEALRSEVLVVPHHGSKTSSTVAFVEAVAPRHAIFAVGHRNRHRHPNATVLTRYVERGATVHRTDRDGALHLRLGPRASPLEPVRRHAAKARYWSDRRISHEP